MGEKRERERTGGGTQPAQIPQASTEQKEGEKRERTRNWHALGAVIVDENVPDGSDGLLVRLRAGTQEHQDYHLHDHHHPQLTGSNRKPGKKKRDIFL